MEIEGYKYIQHNIITRPWGIECQFTVVKIDGTHINDIVMVKSEKADEKEIASLITQRLIEVDHIKEPEPLPEKIYTKTEVESLLVSKGLILSTETIDDLQSKDILIAEAVVKEIIK
jgi:hypothetical protein